MDTGNGERLREERERERERQTYSVLLSNCDLGRPWGGWLFSQVAQYATYLGHQCVCVYVCKGCVDPKNMGFVKVTVARGYGVRDKAASTPHLL